MANNILSIADDQCRQEKFSGILHIYYHEGGIRDVTKELRLLSKLKMDKERKLIKQGGD